MRTDSHSYAQKTGVQNLLRGSAWRASLSAVALAGVSVGLAFWLPTPDRQSVRPAPRNQVPVAVTNRGPGNGAPTDRLLRSHLSRVAATAKDAAGVRRAMENLADLPLSFEPNRGQTGPGVKFLSRGSAYNLFLTGDAAVMMLRPANRARPPATVRMEWLGARQVEPSGRNPLPGKSNYFTGSDRSAWVRNVPQYGRVEYADVYPGIDMVFYGNQRLLEYDMVVGAGADPGRIRIKFHGQQKLRVDESGDLILSAGGSEIRQRKPVLHQSTGGEKKSVDGRYVLLSADEVGFEVAAYDKTSALVIDPVLVYSTYLGGSNSDFANDVAVDDQGFLYVTGGTDSTAFPLQNPLNAANGGGRDAFVTKINPAGNAVVYSTYLGGSGSDWGMGIAVDSAHNIYVAGSTNSANFPMASPVQAANGGGWDGFVTKINSTGGSLAYSTYLGGSRDDYIFGIALDGQLSAYVTGQTTSANFPTAGPLQAVFGGVSDAFVTKYSSAGTQLSYSTYLGGSGGDAAERIAVDNLGNASITGATNSTNFPTAAPLQAANGGGVDAFVSKLNASGAALTYSTYLGGTDTDWATDIALDGQGTAFLTGYTLSANFPTATPAQSRGGAADAFVTHLNGTGSALLYSTYFGGSGDDYGNGIAVDSSGSAYVTGTTSGGLTLPAGAIQPNAGGGRDSYFLKLAPAGSSVTFGTYLGGSGDEEGYGIAVDSVGNAYLAGITSSRNFPTNGALQESNQGPYDLYLAKLLTVPVLTVSTSAVLSNYRQGTANPASQQFTVDATGGSLPFTVQAVSAPGWLSFTPSSGAATPAQVTVSMNPAGLAPGTYSATLTVASPGQVSHNVTVTLNVQASTLSHFPSAFTFNAQAGSTAVLQAQQLGVYENTNAAVSLTATAVVTTPVGGAWLSVAPPTGTTFSYFSVTANAAGLAAGTYTGNIHIAAPNLTPFDVPVTLNVTSTASLVQPDSVYFNYSIGQGGQGVLQQDVPVVSNGTGVTFGVSTTVISPVGASWLSALPTGGTAAAGSPVTITVSANPVGLSPGYYEGTVDLTVGNQVTSIYVALSVADPVFCLGSQCQPFSSPFVFTALAGSGPQSSSYYFYDQNAGGDFSFYTLPSVNEPPQGTWLSFTGSDGVFTNSDVTIGVDPTGLTPGTYTGSIAFYLGEGVAFTVPVNLVITQPTLSVSSLNTFTTTTGVAPPSQSLTVSTTPATSLDFTAAIATSSGGNWLGLSALTGRTNGSPLTVTANPTGLQPGTYNGTITITAGGVGNSPQVVPVSLVIAAPTLTVSSLSPFASNFGGTPATQQLFVTSNVAAPVAFSAAVATSTGGNWLGLSALSGNTNGSPLTVTANATGLAPGSYSGTITITAAGLANSPQAVNVTLLVNVAPGLSVPSTPISFTWTPGALPPTDQTVAVTATAASLTFRAASSVLSTAS